MQKIRIALADNHDKVREMWQYILSTDASFEIVALCCNGLEAVEAAAVYRPDIFLMDINMEEMNGIEATGIISKNHPSIRIIGMSVHAEASYVKGMLEAGARGYLTKTTAYAEVISAIKTVYEGEQYICTEARNEITVFAIAKI